MPIARICPDDSTLAYRSHIGIYNRIHASRSRLFIAGIILLSIAGERIKTVAAKPRGPTGPPAANITLFLQDDERGTTDDDRIRRTGLDGVDAEGREDRTLCQEKPSEMTLAALLHNSSQNTPKGSANCSSRR